MTKNNSAEEKPLAHYIQGIQSGTIAPKKLSYEIILDITEALSAEGSSTSQLAQLFGKGERQVRRYLEAVRKRNALVPSSNLAKEVAGELFAKARASHAYLLRLARSQGGSISEKAQAEFFAWKIWQEFIACCQSVGYLPSVSRPQHIIGEIYHHMADNQDQSLDEIKKMVVEIESVSKETGIVSPEIEKGIEQLRVKIEKAEIVSEVNKLSQRQDSLQQNMEESNDKQPI